jgi:hypothetical protein
MAGYVTKSKKSAVEVLDQALEFFGPEGEGLEIVETAENLAHFRGGGGHVLIETSPADSGTQVDFEVREWDRQVIKFMEIIT